MAELCSDWPAPSRVLVFLCSRVALCGAGRSRGPRFENGGAQVSFAVAKVFAVFGEGFPSAATGLCE